MKDGISKKTLGIILGGVVFAWALNFLFFVFSKPDNSGIVGDTFGMVNALFSGLAFAGVIVALLFQQIEMRNQISEMHDQSRNGLLTALLHGLQAYRDAMTSVPTVTSEDYGSRVQARHEELRASAYLQLFLELMTPEIPTLFKIPQSEFEARLNIDNGVDKMLEYRSRIQVMQKHLADNQELLSSIFYEFNDILDGLYQVALIILQNDPLRASLVTLNERIHDWQQR